MSVRREDRMAKLFMAMQHNSDGRVCGWATGSDLDAVKAEAERQYAAHECYPGEQRGSLCTLQRDGDDERDPFHPIDVCPACQANNDQLREDGR
jgi:hypothetical protein